MGHPFRWCGAARRRASVLSTALSVALLAASAATTRPALAQPFADRGLPATGAQRLQNALGNAGIGGATGAVGAILRGRDPLRGFLYGAIGGLTMSAGRQVAGRRFTTAGLVGRELSAVGVSLVHAGERDTLLLLAPLGPAVVELRPRAVDRVRTRLDLVQTGTIAYVAARGGRLDWRATLRTGAPVFRVGQNLLHVGEQSAAVGAMLHGSILLLDPAQRPAGIDGAQTLRHETVHVLQYDYASQAVALPIERSLLGHVGFWRRPARHLDVGALTPLLLGAIAAPVPYGDRPWEREAQRLTW